MRTVYANGVKLHYEQHGYGSDVILVHGITGNLSYWLLTLLPRLMERHRVTLYDLRGHGFSEVPPSGYTTGEMARDLHGLMDGLGIKRAHIVGHSYGGAIALHHALLYPERTCSLVIADSAIPALRRYVSIAEWPLYGELQELLSPFGVRLPADPDRWDIAEMLPELSKLPTVVGLRQGLPRQERRVRRLSATTTCLEDVKAVDGLTEERICAVAVPTLAVYSDRSPFLAICRYLEEHLPCCRSVIQAGGDHFFPAVAPEALADLVLEHFAFVDERADVPAA
jgi:2-hydroxy-6-oxonona-2,4-dienedioate hydrolase/2-succinyl-6-hydroxy-2,4-cyclohexadiene-1-carboxylate synthase